jgi:16S rRNA (cytosine1402-N4)-methyltransferase
MGHVTPPLSIPPPAGAAAHLPVLLEESLAALDVRPGGRYIDATLGGGGHAEAILEHSSPDGMLLALDRDGEAVDAARRRLGRFGSRLVALHRNFSRVEEAAREEGFPQVDGILFDLGFSSLQMDDPARGLSFRADAPLDMRLDRSEGITARQIVNSWSRDDLARLFRDLGEEPQARRIAAAILERRQKAPLETTGQLASLVAEAVGRSGGRIHPATRVFQALRMAVNGELEHLRRALPAATALLRAGGRLVVISFHSLEDRTVKEYIRAMTGRCSCPPHQPVCTCRPRAILSPVGKGTVKPSAEEVRRNRRSRSARLRAAVKLEVAA